MVSSHLTPPSSMKTFPSPLRRLAVLAGAAAALVAGAAAAVAQTAFPYGDWDCLISERQSGLAVLRFEPGTNTFSGVQIMRPGYGNGNLMPPSTNPRFPGGEPTRDGQEPVPTSSGTNSVFVGATAIQGSWYFDQATNRIIGFLDQVTVRYELAEVITTNINALTGLPVVLTNLTYTNTFFTNSVSFRASGTGGKRLTLTAYLKDGKKNIYRGTPSVAVTNQSGSFYASGKRSGVPYVEFFTLNPNPGYPLPNVYSLDGSGAGYGFTGWAIVSRTGRIALYNQTDREPYRITTYLGPYNASLRRGNINGYDDTGKKPSYRLTGY